MIASSTYTTVGTVRQTWAGLRRVPVRGAQAASWRHSARAAEWRQLSVPNVRCYTRSRS